MSAKRLQVRLSADPPPRLDKALARDLPEAAALSRTQLARLLADGAVTRAGVPVGAKASAVAGDLFEIVVPEAAETEMRPEPIPLDVVYEDDALIVVNKPAGMVVHPAPGAPSGTLVNALLHHCGNSLSGIGGEKRPGIVHRIDKDTTGLIVAAKTDAAHRGLAAQFEAHSVERAYQALVYGVPDLGDPRLRGLRGVTEDGGRLKITTQLARHKTDRQRPAVLAQAPRRPVTRAHDVDLSSRPPWVQCRLDPA